MSLIKGGVLFLCIVFLGHISFSKGIIFGNVAPYIYNAGLKNIAAQNSNPISFNKVYVIDQPLLQLRMAIDTRLDGLLNYHIHEATFSPDLTIKLNATLVDISCYGSYNMNGTYYKILPLKGDGSVSINLKNFTIFVSSKIVGNGGHIKLLYYDTDYKFDNMELSIGGLAGQVDVANIIEYFLRDLVPNVLAKRRNQLVSLLKNSVMTTGNEFLSSATIKTFIEQLKALLIY